MKKHRNKNRYIGFGSTPETTTADDSQFYIGKSGQLYVEEPNGALASNTNWLTQPVGMNAVNTSGSTNTSTFQYDPKAASDAVNSRIGINSSNVNTVIANSTTAKAQRDAAMQPVIDQLNQYNQWKADQNAQIEQSADYLSKFKFDPAMGVYLPVSAPPAQKKSNNTILYVGIAAVALGAVYLISQKKKK